MSFSFMGLLGTGTDLLTFTADVPASTRDVARVIVVGITAQIPATAAFDTTRVLGSPPSLDITSVVDSGVGLEGTPPLGLETDYEPGCYAEWQQFCKFGSPTWEYIGYGNDIGFRDIVAGLGVWTYASRERKAGSKIRIHFADTPSTVLTWAAWFEGARSPDTASPRAGWPLSALNDGQDKNSVASQHWWATWPPLTYSKLTDDCVGAFATRKASVPIGDTEQDPYTYVPNKTGLVIAYARAYGVRSRPHFLNHGLDTYVTYDSFDPGDPSGPFASYGTVVGDHTGTVDFKQDPSTSLLNDAPWRTQWRYKVTDGAVGSADLRTQWECPGHDHFDPDQDLYRQIPAATSVVSMQKAGDILPDGQMPCYREIYITSDHTIQLPGQGGGE